MTEGPYKLPEGWRWVRLGEVCEVWDALRKPVKKKDRRLGDVPYCGANGIIDYVDGYTHVGEFVLLAEDGGFYGPGEPSAYMMNGRFWANNHVHVLRGKSGYLVNQFLYYWLVFCDLRPFLTGTTRPKLTQTAMHSIPIPLPPLEEQRRIVARVEELMSRIREAKRLRQEAKEEAERLWQSILSETFPKPGSELPKGWRWVRLGDVCEYRTGIWGPEASDPTQGFPIIRSTEIEGLLIRPQTASVRMVRRGQVDAYKLETGDILINKSSGSPHLVGWPAIFEDPRDGKIYLFSNFMLRLRADRRTLEPWFLLYYLHSPTARSIYLGAQDTTSGLRNLRVREFMVQPIPLPPLEEQRRIVAYFQDVQEKIRALKEAQAQTEAELKRLEQAILDKAFRGEL
jgi:type I restriction enzyme S subunit